MKIRPVDQNYVYKDKPIATGPVSCIHSVLTMQKEDIPPKLQEQFAAFEQFSTSRFFGQQADPIAVCTAEKYADHVR